MWNRLRRAVAEKGNSSTTLLARVLVHAGNWRICACHRCSAGRFVKVMKVQSGLAVEAVDVRLTSEHRLPRAPPINTDMLWIQSWTICS